MIQNTFQLSTNPFKIDISYIWKALSVSHISTNGFLFQWSAKNVHLEAAASSDKGLWERIGQKNVVHHHNIIS